jgi:hypothetical protein
MPVETFVSDKSEATQGSGRLDAADPYAGQSMSDDPRTNSLWLIKRTMHALLCIAIPVCVWALIVQWSTEHVKQQLEQQIPQYDPMKEVKKFEFKQFDVEAFHKSMGIGSE